MLDHGSPFANPTGWETLAAQDDDYEDLMTAFSEITSNISTGPRLSKKTRRATRLTPQRIAAIAKAVDEGRIHLPDLDLPTDNDYCAVWALVDSGSAVHAVDAKKTFPTQNIDPPPPRHRGFAVADGTRIPHGGFVTTDVVTQEGQRKPITWKNASVSMPILSTHDLARNGYRLAFEENGGQIINRKTGETTDFVQRDGVDFGTL